jgi:hypothetical protein
MTTTTEIVIPDAEAVAELKLDLSQLEDAEYEA